MELTRLIYVSKHKGLSIEALDRILGSSRANNVRDSITGALVIGDRHFVQVLEGSREAVSRCFMRIMCDKRHHDLQVICAGDSANRLFFEWSMHRIATSQIKPQILSGYEVNGVFDPARLTQGDIEDLCRTLSLGNWMATAA